MKYLGIIIKTTLDESSDRVRYNAVMSEQFDYRTSAEEWIYQEKKNIEKRNKVLGPRFRTNVNESTIIAVNENDSSDNYEDFLAILVLNFRN